MKKYVLILFLLNNFWGNSQEVTQDSLLPTSNQELLPTNEKTHFEYVVIESGVTIPLGKLAEKVGIAPTIGFWGRCKIREHDILNFGFSVSFPMKSHYFEYTVGDQKFQTKPKSFMGMAGLRMDKIFPVNQKVNVEWSSTLGYAFFTYNDVWARYKNENSEEPDSGKSGFVKAFSTFHIGQGIKISRRDIGFQAQYNYTPYHIFSDYIQADFGTHSLTIGIFYRQ